MLYLSPVLFALKRRCYFQQKKWVIFLSTLGAKSNKRCDRLKYQIEFRVQKNPIVFIAKSTVLGIRLFSNQSQEFLYGSHLYRSWALPLKRWDLC